MLRAKTAGTSLATGEAAPEESLPTEQPRLRLPYRTPGRVDAVAIGAILLALAYLWGRGRTVWYWLDEGLSIGFASHSFADIPTLLRQDGAPPLYYWILHGWMRLFGSSESATHTLSLLFALGAVVAAWWAGRTLFGRRTAWVLVVLAAVNPFLASYANETRMYTLVVLLSTVTVGCFLHAFAFGRRRYLVPFSLALTLLLYTHNWALLFALGAVVALVPCMLTADDRRRIVVDAVLAFGAAAILYAPWVPTLLYQVEHTGAPWSPVPTLEAVREQVSNLVGGTTLVVAIGLGIGVALSTMFRTRPWTREAVATAAAAVIPVVAISVAWLISRQGSIWAFRYLGAVLPALLLVVAVGLARGGQPGLAALGVVVFLSAPIDVKTPPYVKSNVRDITNEVSALMRPGDLVISPDYGEVPLLAHYLPPGLRYATAEGLVADPLVADQRDAAERLHQVRPEVALRPLLDALPVGGRVLLVCPPVSVPSPNDVAFTRSIMDRCADVNQLLASDVRLTPAHAVNPSALDVYNTPVNGTVFTRRLPD